MRRMFSALLMTAVMATPFALASDASAGQSTTDRARVRVRVYDPYRRDYHQWNSREQREYRAYLAERHQAYVRYQRQRLAERRAYWRWRHEREERLEHRR